MTSLPLVAPPVGPAPDREQRAGIERDYVRWYPARIAATDADTAWREPGMGLYAHVPYCAHRCHFCKYKVKVGDDLGAEMDAFLVALKREIDTVRRRGPVAGRPLSVVYIGGGTPSLLSAGQLAGLLRHVTDSFELAADCEFTVECNPSSLTEEKLLALRAGGVNRLSVGVQSLQDDILADIGRDHTAAQARRTLAMVAAAGFGNINLDLIYRLPGQTVAGVQESVRAAIECAPAHLSLYPLWVREGTILWARMQAGDLELPDEQVEQEMFDAARELLTASGYQHYNVFDFVAPDVPRCRYTELQWEDGDWVGVGPSAVSYVAGRHLVNTHSIRDYLEMVTATGAATTAGATLPVEARMRRTMMFGLRMSPFDLGRFRRQYGVDVETVFGPELAALLAEGLVVRDGDLLRLTPAGVRGVNTIGKLFYEAAGDRQSLGLSRRGVPLVEVDR
jgi:oxygen-independent coproporphyrinogen-3 oxidase